MTDFLTLQPSDAPFTKGDEIEFKEKTGVTLRDFFTYWDLTRLTALEPGDEEYLDNAELERTYIRLRSGFQHVNEDKCASWLVFIQYRKTNPDLKLADILAIDSRDFMSVLQKAFEAITPDDAEETDVPLEATPPLREISAIS